MSGFLPQFQTETPDVQQRTVEVYKRNNQRMFTFLEKQYDHWKAGEVLLSLDENQLPWSNPVVRRYNMQQRLLPEALIWYRAGDTDYAFDNIYGNPSVTEEQFGQVLDVNAQREKEQHDSMWDVVTNPQKYKGANKSFPDLDPVGLFNLFITLPD